MGTRRSILGWCSIVCVAALPALASGQSGYGWGAPRPQQGYPGYGAQPGYGGAPAPGYGAAPGHGPQMPAATPPREDLELRVAQNDAELGRALSEIERAEGELVRTQSELGSLDQRRSQAFGMLRARVRALYRITRGGLLPASGGIDALMAHAARVERLRRMVARDIESVTELRQRGTDLRAAQARLNERLSQARRQRQTFEARKRQLEEERRQAEVYAYALAMAGAQAAAQPWAANPMSMPQQTQPQASQGQVRDLGYGQIVLRGDDPSADAEEGDTFASMRGNLSSPVAGEVSLRRAADGTGLDLVAQPGRGVRAVAPGTVIFAGRDGARGLSVILDHGDRYQSVYGGLRSLDLQVGDHVGQGARVGTIAGESAYFGIRRGNRSLDARSWLGM
ncbi:MAG: peptidoglycan DD-metalloendopeptidase family protein [Deltaproteobacteria bacterium]|nr:peptidoglycan DD-metalloendopeptidase family protein [Deltaproteobacteria bacterium]